MLTACAARFLGRCCISLSSWCFGMVRLKLPDGWLDYDLNLFMDIARPLDREIQELLEVVKTDWNTADMFDYPLTIEQLLGVGLAAAQVYMTSAMREQKAPRKDALALGPLHPRGHTLAQLINHGANFWKHADEWDYDVPDKRRDAILRAFSGIGIPDDHWQLLELVRSITGASEPRLTNLQPLLEEWRVALDESFPGDRGRALPASEEGARGP